PGKNSEKNTIGGGDSNCVQGLGGTISGGVNNSVMSEGSTVSGGKANLAKGNYSTISGGNANEAGSDYSCVSGGNTNKANGDYSVICGGLNNTIYRYMNPPTSDLIYDSGILGGKNNQIRQRSSYAIGSENILNAGMVGASGSYAIGSNNIMRSAGSYSLGHNNTVNASQSYAMGNNNTISASNSCAIGNRFTITGNSSIGMGNLSALATLSLRNAFVLPEMDAVGIGTINPGNGGHARTAGYPARILHISENDPTLRGAWLLLSGNTPAGAGAYEMRCGIGFTPPEYNGRNQWGIGMASDSNSNDFMMVRYDTATGAQSNPVRFPATGPYAFYVNGAAYATGGWQSSDARFKQDIASIFNPLDKISSLNPVEFSWNKESFPDRGFDNRRHMGLLAQEVEKVIPELVMADEKGYEAIEYTSLIPMLVGAVKELKAENDELKQRITALENNKI
ncbi:MAG: tail fiber domain-containing protein, partial [Candidatus Omnitrophica bacterium]|nr:tail fiber domain-containing protein [Candidatus Omnitrophota bacterium]